MARDVGQCPVALAAVEKPDAQARHNGRAAGRVLLPVGGKGVEVVAVEIHHREQPVHKSFSEPPLRFLPHRHCAPPHRAVSTQVGVLADGGATHFYPRAHGLHLCRNLAHAARHVVAPPLRLLRRRKAFAVFLKGGVVVEGDALFGITDIVEVNAVYVVLPRHFRANVGEIVVRARHSGVHHPLVAAALAERGPAFWQGAVAQCLDGIGFPDGETHYPSVALHAPAVAFRDGKSQGVVKRGASRHACEHAVPRLDVGGVRRGAAQACLEEHGVDARLAHTVEQAAERLLLFLCRGGRGGGATRPV